MASIQFENVSLAYPVRNHAGISLKEFLLRRFRREKIQLVRSIQAIKDMTFQIGDGERVGIIGYNGAGKSTLLRTIAGVYPTSSGTRIVQGAICSLFDMYLGFEQEATGYENIYYRLYLQGETPKTVERRIQSIIDFCELGDFIRLPIRCYSAGMVMRLAFAIATSGDLEILLVDEVFATGDLAFQKKAEKRMKDFMSRAKIVAMVGHNLSFLEEFCTRVLWIDQGQIRLDGSPLEVVSAYRAAAEEKRLAA